ncbi:hypothetical protein FRC12_025230 [Ceratobasidium sp. 428]|nr:hypothetical protein FRC12_025230 [Ceratobasidium sp. 428]
MVTLVAIDSDNKNAYLLSSNTTVLDSEVESSSVALKCATCSSGKAVVPDVNDALLDQDGEAILPVWVIFKQESSSGSTSTQARIIKKKKGQTGELS